MSIIEVAWTDDGARGGGLHRPGPGPTIVLLHGAGGSAQTWAPIIEAWPEADVWAVDLPGRGGSAGPAKASAGEVAAWLLAAGEANQWPRPVLVGHSYGGAVALSAAAARPEAVAGVVMVSSGARLRVAPAILEVVAAATDQAPYRLDPAFGAATEPAVIEAYHRDCRATPARSTHADWQACDGFDRLADLEGVDAPTLVLAGDADFLTPPKHQARLAARLPAGELRMLPGIGHMLPWEAPARFAEVVQDWASRLLRAQPDVR